ncbi:hypothetical protein [Methylobacter psychrophilus]|uniref:hypothetical protein n=1 Tax=Methylobacter psychrophilus TaxID=96941 RepID=UPI0021D517DA|nr:hypothetical protein [Methylobacter psychrophilus]
MQQPREGLRVGGGGGGRSATAQGPLPCRAVAGVSKATVTLGSHRTSTIRG